MASYNHPVKNTAWRTGIALYDFATPGALKSSPTLAAGDFKVSIDFGAFNNLATLPAVAPAASVSVQIDLSAAEMNGDVVVVTWIDQTAPKEWADGYLCILTAVS